MPKDKRAFVFFVLSSLCLLELGNTFREIALKNDFTHFVPDNPLFSIVNVKNTGAAFGMFSSHSGVLMGFGIAILLFLLFYAYKCAKFEDKISLTSLTLFFAGVLGNVLERFHFKYVNDYIKLNFVDFAIFNAFDAMINVAILLYLIYFIGEEWKILKTKK